MKKKKVKAAPLIIMAIIWGGCKTPPQIPESEKMIKRHTTDKLVIVYSLTNTTAKMAKTLSNELHTDYIRISDPERKSVNFITSPNRNRAVTYEPEQVDLSRYKVIFLGTPVWWMKPTAYIYSFIKNHDFSGKKVVLFYTYRGWLYDSAKKDWQDLVGKQGGEVIDIIGINCKTLDNKTVETATREIMQSQRAKWKIKEGSKR